MNWTSIGLTVIVPAVVSLVSVYISLRLLPLNMQLQRGDAFQKMSQTIMNLNETVGELMKDLAEEKKITRLQATQIKQLMDREQLTVKTELHIQLSDPPVITDAKAEYLMNAISKTK